MKLAEIKVLVGEILGDALGKTGFDHAEVRAAPNYADEEALFIDAHFKPGSPPDIERPTMRVMGELRSALLDRDEPRFPYLQYVFPGDEPVGVHVEAE